MSAVCRAPTPYVAGDAAEPGADLARIIALDDASDVDAKFGSRLLAELLPDEGSRPGADPGGRRRDQSAEDPTEDAPYLVSQSSP